jgi:hypothetical protein
LRTAYALEKSLNLKERQPKVKEVIEWALKL